MIIYNVVPRDQGWQALRNGLPVAFRRHRAHAIAIASHLAYAERIRGMTTRLHVVLPSLPAARTPAGV